MEQVLPIRSALISVFHKDGLAPIVKKLNDHGVTIYSTGGTEQFIQDMGIPVVAVDDLTEYPSILCGLVKTLHPKNIWRNPESSKPSRGSVTNE